MLPFSIPNIIIKYVRVSWFGSSVGCFAKKNLLNPVNQSAVQFFNQHRWLVALFFVSLAPDPSLPEAGGMLARAAGGVLVPEAGGVLARAADGVLAWAVF
jgi:hypothetical protein